LETIEELRREAEEAKEKVRRDIQEFRNILSKLAEHAGEVGKVRVEAAMHRAEKRIEETAYRVETRFDKAMSVMAGADGGSGKTATRTLDLADFTSVEVDCCFKVDIHQASEFSVTVNGDERLFDYLNTVRSGHTLRLSIKPLHFRARPNMAIRITMPTLRKLRLGAASTCKVSGFTSGDGLDLNLSGASTLEIDAEAGRGRVEISGASRLKGNLVLADAEFVLSGASQAELRGSANNVVLNAWGASRLVFGDFTVRDASVHLKGASRAAVNAGGRLDLDLSGGSRLSYVGSPTMGDINVSGASTLTQK
jgi:hypothetical protein